MKKKVKLHKKQLQKVIISSFLFLFSLIILNNKKEGSSLHKPPDFPVLIKKKKKKSKDQYNSEININIHQNVVALKSQLFTEIISLINNEMPKKIIQLTHYLKVF